MSMQNRSPLIERCAVRLWAEDGGSGGHEAWEKDENQERYRQKARAVLEEVQGFYWSFADAATENGRCCRMFCFDIMEHICKE